MAMGFLFFVYLVFIIGLIIWFINLGVRVVKAYEKKADAFARAADSFHQIAEHYSKPKG